MIYRLIYCNKNGDSARIDIIKGALTPVETIEGTDNPFLLSYKMDTSNKSGFFMTSSANISVYESGTFNIDNLKTSSETELKVEYYINDVLFWSGFIIPDFFSRNIGVPATIEMVASDRIGTLKGSTLSSLTQYVSMRDIAVACLAKTGLSLPLFTMADFGNNGQTNSFFKSLGLSGRLSDTKGRNISCYDILRSILVACDGKLLQQDGAWYIVNKFQHEQGSGNLFSSLTASTPYVEQSVPFSEVDTGARRTIVPVAATTGVYHEHGGGRKYPDNYNFADGLAGWTAKNGFVASIDNKKIDFYLFGAPSFSETETVPPYLLNNNQRILSGNSMDLVPYIESSPIAVKAVEADRVKVNIDISVTAPGGASHLTDPAAYPSFVRYAVIATNGPTKLALNRSGAFETYNPNSYETQTLLTHVRNTLNRASFADDISSAVSGTLIAGNDIANYNITIRIYGSGTYQTVLINQATITFSTTNSELPKGTIYRRNQGAGFTSEYPTDTTIFGDYMSIGLNGYFYNYSIDDTSSLFSAPDILIQPKWTAHADANELPLLQHVARQRSRMFSIAHDLINASIDVEAFKPLSIFVDCNSKRYCVVSANFDFLRSKVEVEIEQISYASLEVREFIYSYFGDSDTGISSVGGISGGGTGTGTGGGMTAEQIEILNNLSSWWKLDSSDILYSDKNVRAPSFIGSLTGNADTAIKLQTARTIAGVSFDGTANIAIPFANLSSKPTTLAGYGITNAYTKTEVDTALALKLNKSVFDDLFEKVEISTGVFAIKAKYTFFSTYGVSAYGPGTGGGGGGGSLSGLSDVMLTSLAANNLLQFNGTHWVNVPASSVGTPVSWGTTSNNTSPLTVSGITKTVSLSGHLHTGVYEPVFTKNTAFNKNFGTASGTVAQGNDSRIINGQTAYGWGNHSGLYLPLTGGTMANTNLVTNLNADLLDGYHASEIAETGLLYTYRAVAVGAVNFWHKLGTLTLPAVTGNGRSKVVAQITGLANFGTNEHRILILKASTRVSVEVNGLMIKGNSTDVRVGYVNNGSTIEIWVGYVGFYNTDTNIEVLNSKNFTVDRVVQASMPVNFVTCPILVSATTASNVASATKLQTARTLTIGNTGKTFDGTANVAWSLSEIGALPLTGGTMSNTNVVTNLNADLLDGYHSTRFALQSAPAISTDFLVWDGATLFGLRAWAPSTPNYPVDPYGTALDFKDATTWYHRLAFGTSGRIRYYNGINTTTLTKRGDLAFTTDNVASATKLQTPRTIWGQSFDGTGNVTGALSGATTGSFTGTITSPLYQSGTYNWTGKTAGFHSGTDGYQTGGFSIYNGTGTTANFYRLDNLLILGRAANQSLTIDTSSNVSILGNTTTNRIILSSTAAEAHIEFSRPGINYLTAPLNGGISFITNGDSLSAVNSMLVLSPNGYVGVGKGFTNSTTAITAQLHVRGTILATGGITAYTASDKRFKTDIRDITTGLNTVMKLNPVMYSYNSLAKGLNATLPDFDYGLIAQDVKDVMPDIVHSMFNGEYLGIDYIKLIPILISAIKEQQSQISELKKMLNA